MCEGESARGDMLARVRRSSIQYPHGRQRDVSIVAEIEYPHGCQGGYGMIRCGDPYGRQGGYNKVRRSNINMNASSTPSPLSGASHTGERGGGLLFVS